MSGICRGMYPGLFFWVVGVLIFHFLAIPSRAIDNQIQERRLSFYNTHTRERLTVIYKNGDGFVPGSMEKISYILRDHRADEIHAIDPRLMDFLYDLLTEVNNHGEVHIISGYRSPKTNFPIIIKKNEEHTMKAGLIIVDIQNDYFPGGRMELTGISEAGQKAGQLLSVFRENNWPTFHIQHVSVQPGATFFLPETAGAEIHDCISPFSEERVIQKHYPNSFRETDLLDELQKRAVEKVVICGAMSHMCVDATTRAAFDFGFECRVVQDACATRNLEFGGKTITAEQVHGSFMAALGSAYAGVLTVEEFKSSL